MELLGGNTHSSLFSQNLKFSFSPKLRGVGGNELDLMNFFLTPKIHQLYFEILQHPQAESAHHKKDTKLSTDLYVQKKIFRNIHKSPSSPIQIILESLKKKIFKKHEI